MSTTDTVHQERLVTGRTGRMLLTLSFGWTVVQIGRQAIPPLLPTIIDDLAISSFAAGVALTIMWGCYALVHYPAGRLADGLGRKTVLVAGIGLVGAGSSLIALAASYPVFVLATSIVGIGAGLYYVSSKALLADLFVERRGQAFGLQVASGPVGSAAAAGLAIAVLAVATWRVAFVPVVVAAAAVGAMVHWWGDESYGVGRVGLDLRATAVRVFETARRRWLVLAYSLFAFTWQGTIGFFPAFLQAQKGFSPTLASGGFALLFLVGVVTMPLAGRVGDRVGSLPVAGVALLVAAGGLVALLLGESTLAVGLAVVLFAAGLMSFPPVMQAFLMDLFPSGSMAGDFGAFRTVYTVVGSTGPAYVGFVVSRADYTAAYLGLVGCLLGAVGIVVGLRRGWW